MKNLVLKHPGISALVVFLVGSTLTVSIGPFVIPDGAMRSDEVVGLILLCVWALALIPLALFAKNMLVALLGVPARMGEKKAKAKAAADASAQHLAQLRRDYPFLRDSSPLFTKGFTFEFNLPNGEYVWIEVRPVSPRTAAGFQRALVSLGVATSFEAARRGLPIRDEQNKFLVPKATPDGFLLETIENEDGSVDALVVCDVDGVATREDWNKARELTLVGQSPNWRGSLVRSNGQDNKLDGYEPLFLPLIKKVRLSGATANANPFRPQSTQKGSAQWAWVDEMSASSRVAVLHRGQVNWNQRFDAPGAPLGVFYKCVWTDWPKDDYAHVLMRDEGHRIVVGPSGSGKFTAAFAPLLLTADNASALVFDVADGEAARVTAPWRRTLGPVAVIDPFGVTGMESDALNPLDILRADDPEILQAAKQLTDALFIVPPGTANEEYWSEQARDYLTAYLLHVATSETETDRTLRRVRELIRQPISVEVLAAMLHNPIAGGVVSDTAKNIEAGLDADSGKNVYLALQTLRTNTPFLDLPGVQRATGHSTVDPKMLRREVSTLYVCLPEKQLAAVGRWLRLVYAVVMEQVREKNAVPLHVLIDEFPSMKRFDRVKDDMALVRKFGIQMHIATQSLNQLEGLYGADWQSFMANAKYQQLLGVNDQMTAEYFSKGLGTTTRRTTSTGQSRSTGGGSQSTNAGWEAADLMSPDELRRLDPNTTIVLVEGMNPLILTKHHYFEGGLFSARLAGRAPGSAQSEPASLPDEAPGGFSFRPTKADIDFVATQLPGPSGGPSKRD